MRRFAVGLAPLLLVLTSCMHNSLPEEADATRGRELAKLVLDTWAKGGTFADLKSGSPSIVAYDPDWADGAKLVKYDIGSTDGRVGVDLLLPVTLTLTRADGKSQEKRVNFIVAIGSQIAVLRQV
jgi:hypothetical protein